MSSECFKKAVLWIIIVRNHSFFFVELSKFQAFLYDAYSNCTSADQKTMMKYLKAKAVLTKLELKNKLTKNEFKVSFALNV
jgi:hypothetical protein